MPSSEALTIELGSEHVQMYTFVSSIYRLEWKDNLFSASAYWDRAVMYGHSEQSTFLGLSYAQRVSSCAWPIMDCTCHLLLKIIFSVHEYGFGLSNHTETARATRDLPM